MKEKMQPEEAIEILERVYIIAARRSGKIQNIKALFGDQVINTDDIRNAPTVELQIGRMTNGIIIPIERPTGEWEEIIKVGYRCSICHVFGFKTNYCPNCGARMKGAEE